jgi:alkanesulfonate monooxygenase SsuD/methylene tetrahydromethanopterin reductase-like flavin-dependent oxidoreductase (luciferase family)
LGVCVTNPVTRDPSVTASAIATVNRISAGRAALGFGSGDSACRVLGLAPASVQRTEQAAVAIKELASGRAATWRGKTQQLHWARGAVPLFLAGLGPKMNALAGRVADGVIIPVADLDIVAWVIEQTRAAARRAGRDPNALRIVVGAPSAVSGDLERACDRVRYYPAMVANSAAALRKYYADKELPTSLVELARKQGSYDYSQHGRPGTSHVDFVSNETCERFCVIGSPNQIIERLRALETLGVDLWNVYLAGGDEAYLLETYATRVIPALKSHAPLA